MGICVSKDEDSRRNAEIDSQIRKSRKEAEVEVKMLLLGMN